MTDPIIEEKKRLLFLQLILLQRKRKLLLGLDLGTPGIMHHQ